MGDGLKKAALATLATRSWKGGKEHRKDDLPWILTGDEIVVFYEAIVRGDLEPYLVLGCKGMSDRKADRAVQILKTQGLVAHDKSSRAWKAT